MSTFYIKEGDTEPRLAAQLKNPDGSSVDLSTSTVSIRVAESRGGSNIINDKTEIIDATDGKIAYRFTNGDADTVGRYRVEFEVEYDSGFIETYPNSGYHTLLIGRNMEI